MLEQPNDPMAEFAKAMKRQPTRVRLSEKELQALIVNEAERLGLWVFWIPSAARTGIGRQAKTARGWPDLVIGGNRGILFRECKSEDGETSGEQDMWLWLLNEGGCDIGIWRPVDWNSGLIRRELRAIV